MKIKKVWKNKAGRGWTKLTKGRGILGEASGYVWGKPRTVRDRDAKKARVLVVIESGGMFFGKNGRFDPEEVFRELRMFPHPPLKGKLARACSSIAHLSLVGLQFVLR